MTFTGIPFDVKTPYNDSEARRLLRLLMAELRTRTVLARQLGAALAAPGLERPREGPAGAVWDCLWLGSPSTGAPGARPRLTLALERAWASAQLTLPHGACGCLHQRLVGRGRNGFGQIMAEVLEAAKGVLAEDPGAIPFMTVQQRGGSFQERQPVLDTLGTTLKFDLRAAFGASEMGVQAHPEWLAMAFQYAVEGSSGLRPGLLSLGIAFPYGQSRTVKAARFAEMVERTWLACAAPVLRQPWAGTAAHGFIGTAPTAAPEPGRS